MYLKIAGVEREIRMAQMTEAGKLFSGIVASDDFRFGSAQPYHVSLFHNGVVAVEFDIVFNESDSETLAEWLGQEDDMEFFDSQTSIFSL